jgi:hypothetical protein
MSYESGLRVRQHKRREIELPCEFVVAEKHHAQVRFSSSSPALGQHSLRGTSVDVSPGGMCFNSPLYLPRMCEGSLRVLDPAPAGTAPDGSPMHDVVFSQRVRVRRVYMVGPEPTYYVGVAFADPENVDPDIANRMMLLKRHFEDPDGAPDPAPAPRARPGGEAPETKRA